MSSDCAKTRPIFLRSKTSSTWENKAKVPSTYLFVKSGGKCSFLCALLYLLYRDDKKIFEGFEFRHGTTWKGLCPKFYFFYIQRRDKKLYRVNICLTTSFVCRSSNVILQLSVKICKKKYEAGLLCCVKRLLHSNGLKWTHLSSIIGMQQLYKSAKDDYLDDRRDEEPKHVCK